MSSRADVSGKVLVVHEPSVTFSASVLPAVRDSLNPLARQARGALSTSLSHQSSLAYLWYLTPESGLRDARTVLVQLSCLSRFYTGTAETFDFSLEASNTKRNSTKLMREADLILLVYRSDKPDTLTQLPTWQRLIEERRGKTDKEPACPPADYGLLALHHRPENTQQLSEQTRIDYSQKLKAARSFVVTVPDVSQADAEMVALQCMQMIVDCNRKRRGLPVITASVCPSGCTVKTPHQHLTSEDEFLGKEHTVVMLPDPQRIGAPASPITTTNNNREESRQVEMPRGSVAPKQVRTIVSRTDPPVAPTSALKASPKVITRTALSPGTALPANSFTTPKPEAAGERSSLLVRVPKR